MLIKILINTRYTTITTAMYGVKLATSTLQMSDFQLIPQAIKLYNKLFFVDRRLPNFKSVNKSSFFISFQKLSFWLSYYKFSRHCLSNLLRRFLPCFIFLCYKFLLQPALKPVYISRMKHYKKNFLSQKPVFAEKRFPICSQKALSSTDS